MSWAGPKKPPLVLRGSKPKTTPNVVSPRAIRDRVNGFHKD